MRFLTLLFVVLLVASCSIQKRHYRPGFFVQQHLPDKTASRITPEKKAHRDTVVEIATAAVPENVSTSTAAEMVAPAATPGSVNAGSHDTLVPFKKQKKQLKPLPGETPEETAAREQHRREARNSGLLLLGGLLLTLFYEFGILVLVCGVIIGTLGFVLLLITLIGMARAKIRLRHRQKGLPDRGNPKEKGMTIGKSLLGLLFSGVASVVTLFVLLNNFLLSLLTLLIFGATVFLIFLVILIGLLVVALAEKKQAKKQPGGDKPLVSVRRSYFLRAIVCSVFVLAGLVMGLLGLPFGYLVLTVGALLAINYFAKMIIRGEPVKASGA